MKLLLDMNLPPRWVQFLSGQGFECVHWSDVGEYTATDSFIMAYAKEHGYTVFTDDLDFGALLAATRARSPSAIQVRTQNLVYGEEGRTKTKKSKRNIMPGCPKRQEMTVLP